MGMNAAVDHLRHANVAPFPEASPAPPPLHRADVVRPSADIDAGELGRSLALLRHTSLQISLFHIRFKGHGIGASAALVTDLFGDNGIVQSLNDGSFLVLAVRFDDDESNTTARVVRALREAVCRPGSGARTWVEVSSLHRDAAAVRDLEDLVAELSLDASRCVCLAAA